MKTIPPLIRSLLLLLALSLSQTAWADGTSRTYEIIDQQQVESTLLSGQELEELVAPIALYPDPLIAQMLPAATFADQIGVAARHLREQESQARIDSQYWDVSVKALAHYPDLLFMMAERYDWTVALGQAYLEQPEELMAAIQYLRRDARGAGNLLSTPQQQVIEENGAIRILPAEPELIYVPTYDPWVVYSEPPSPATGFITFGPAFVIGVWLNRDCDWHGRRVYYHGWRGHGWVARSRHHVHTRNRVYVGSNNRVVRTNRHLLQHDNRSFRHRIRSDATVRRQFRPERSLPHGERPPEGTNPSPHRDIRNRSGTAPRERSRNGTAPPPGGTVTPGGEERSRRAVPATDSGRHRERDRTGSERNRPENGDGAPQQHRRSDRSGDRRGEREREGQRPTTPPHQQPRTRGYRGGEGMNTAPPSRPASTPAGRDAAPRRDQVSPQPASHQPGSGHGSDRDAATGRGGGTRGDHRAPAPPPSPAPRTTPLPSPAPPQQRTPPPPRPATEPRTSTPAGGRGENATSGAGRTSPPRPAATEQRRAH